MRVFKYLFSAIIFISIVILLWRGLSLHPAEVPSPLINQAAPVFTLPTLFDEKKNLTNKNFLGQVSLFNVWASWCGACEEEHGFLMQISQKYHVALYGLNYKDDPKKAKLWLKQNGNPYQLIGSDSKGMVAIDWGVYGTPETFVIDKHGIIRYKQIGPITEDDWKNNLWPLIKRLSHE